LEWEEALKKSYNDGGDVAKTTICTTCGTQGDGKTVTRGSIFIELILWVCFLIPGLIYSVWRLTTRRKACRACGSSALVPLDSPVGRKMADGAKS
jgi:hypothetical protein